MNYLNVGSYSKNQTFIESDTKCVSIPNYVLIVTGVSAGLSIIGAFIIIYSYYKIPEIRNFVRKMLLALTVADALTAIGNLGGTLRYAVLSPHWDCAKHTTEVGTDAFCKAQSFVTTFSSMASFFWTTVIVVHVYLTVVYRSHNLGGRRMVVTYHVLCWGIPGLITVIAASMDILGEDHTVGTSTWCWIRNSLDDATQITWMFISGKFWEILCYLSTVSLYVLLKLYRVLERRRGRRFDDLNNVGDFRKEDINFMYIFLILYVLRIWGTVRFFLAITQKHVDNIHVTNVRSYLLVLQGIGDSGQAFWNCVLFCLCDKKVRQELCGRVRQNSAIQE